MFMHNSTNESLIEICQALIYYQGNYLMQLRDFKPGIEQPGQWGFFAGKLEVGECPEQGIWREIDEELCWQPRDFQFLGNLESGIIRMHIFHCELHNNVETLSLQEGEEIGIFNPEVILKGQLYSQKRKDIFPITEISLNVFKKFSSASLNLKD
jgi:8-oxo-dGTP diphosphatase